MLLVLPGAAVVRLLLWRGCCAVLLRVVAVAVVLAGSDWPPMLGLPLPLLLAGRLAGMLLGLLVVLELAFASGGLSS